jgi:hypothetical protein
MRMTMVLLLLITVFDIIPLKVISDNFISGVDDDDDDNGDNDADEGQDDMKQDDEDEDDTDENLTVDAESTPEDDEMDDLSDEEWMKTAVRDIAFYLRSHKFNDFDRRYHAKDSTAPRVSNLTKSDTSDALLHVQSLLPWSTARCKGSEIGKTYKWCFLLHPKGHATVCWKSAEFIE